jgi:flagellar assembly protein FliH
LRKIIKSANSDATQAFRLHYFPAIPAEGAGAPTVACGGGAFRNLQAADASLPLGQAAPRGETDLQAEKDAGARLADIERQAYQEGFARGERDARAAGQRQLEPVLAGLQQLLGSLDAGRQKLRREAEQEIVALALAVARKIVGQELRTNETALARIVREAIGRTGVAGPIRVRLHPDDLQRMQSAHEGIAALPADGGQVHFEADSAISGGGCLVETEWGQIDARVEEQFRVIEEAFRAEMMPSGEREAERP